MAWKAEEKKIEADTKKDMYCQEKLEDLKPSLKWPQERVKK